MPQVLIDSQRIQYELRGPAGGPVLSFINGLTQSTGQWHPYLEHFGTRAGALVTDRFLYTPMRYPGNYGFVSHTLSDDGDPIDVLVANSRPIISGAVINVRPIGVLKIDDEGGGDEKIIAVPMPKLIRRYAHITSIAHLPQITVEQIQHFFEHYKDLEPGKMGEADRMRRQCRSASIDRRCHHPRRELTV
jgi:inorganic pyrophosphatase